MDEHIKNLIVEYERPKRVAVSRKFPLLKQPSIFVKRLLRYTKNKATLSILKKGPYLDHVLARHSSILLKKLGNSDVSLQLNKVTNLKIAIKALDGLIIPPGDTFSLWNNVGSVNKKKGYVDGMLLSNGQVSKGIGGGLCQLSNFLFWIFLHVDTEIIERHHHSIDIFPDSGRTLPFGSGATIFYNYLDLKIKNTSNSPLQIKLWIDDTCLRGQILSDKPAKNKFHIKESVHYFIERNKKYFRYNELSREVYHKGEKISEAKLMTNFAPVMYPVTQKYLEDLKYKSFLL